jgi:hypothetical protein
MQMSSFSFQISPTKKEEMMESSISSRSISSFREMVFMVSKNNLG